MPPVFPGHVQAGGEFRYGRLVALIHGGQTGDGVVVVEPVIDVVHGGVLLDTI